MFSVSVPWLNNKLPKWKNALIFATTILMGLPIGLQVLALDLYFFYFCSFVYGIGGAGVSVACNSGCLEIWRGRDGGGPMMHAIHFFVALGHFTGPIVAAWLIEAENGTLKVIFFKII